MFYDNSPEMVDDLPKPAAPSVPAATPGATTSAPVAAPATSEKPTPLVAVPASIQELRKSDAARQLFDAEGMHREIGDDLGHLLDPMAPAELRRAGVREMQEIISDLGASHSDVRQVLSHARAFATKLPSAEEETHLQHQCLDSLQRRFGPEAEEAAEDARRLVARDPRLAAWLEDTGLGNHPEVVLKFAELARAERSRGRLR